MTREEAIDVLKHPNEMYQGTDGVVGYTFNPNRRNYEAFQLAIKSLEQEPCEDAVSRKGIVEYIKTSDAELGHDSENESVVKDILNMPPVKPVACIATVKFSKEDMQELVNEKMKDIVVERKKGKWIDGHCSECGCDVPAYIIDWKWQKDMSAKYCPNCGAEMEDDDAEVHDMRRQDLQ